MLPRTDQFIELNDGEIEIAGLATPQDLVWYLLKALREFLSVAACLERDANGNYIVRDRRAGTLPSVTGAWTRVHTAAQLVLASTLVPANSSPELDGVVKAVLRSATPSRPLADAARSLTFMLFGAEITEAIPVEKVARIRSIEAQIGELAMSEDIDRLNALQLGLHRWVAKTPGARKHIQRSLVPKAKEAVLEQETRAASQRDAIGRFMSEIDCGHTPRTAPIPELIRKMYRENEDPRYMTVRDIEALRKRGDSSQADLAETIAVLVFHDAGEAGSLEPLLEVPAQVSGKPCSFDLTYFSQCRTGLVSSDWRPRLSAAVMERMIERFKAKVPCALEKPDGWTVADLARQADVSVSTFHRMRRKAGLPTPKHGEHSFRYGPEHVEKLGMCLRTSENLKWRPVAARVLELIAHQS